MFKPLLSLTQPQLQLGRCSLYFRLGMDSDIHGLSRLASFAVSDWSIWKFMLRYWAHYGQPTWNLLYDLNTCLNIKSAVKIRWCACAWWNWNGMKQQGQSYKSKGGRVVCSHS